MATPKLAPEVAALNAVLTALHALQSDDDKTWVLETAATRIGSSGMKPSYGVVPRGRVGMPTTVGDSPKDFMRAKHPQNDTQRVACLAFYLTHRRETPQFKSTDISALNTEAAGPKLNVSRAVNNATNQNRYLAAAGGGRKQITAQGEDVVNALPNQEAVKAAEARGASRKRRKKGLARNKGKP